MVKLLPKTIPHVLNNSFIWCGLIVAYLIHLTNKTLICHWIFSLIVSSFIELLDVPASYPQDAPNEAEAAEASAPEVALGPLHLRSLRCWNPWLFPWERWASYQRRMRCDEWEAHPTVFETIWGRIGIKRQGPQLQNGTQLIEHSWQDEDDVPLSEMISCQQVPKQTMWINVVNPMP